MHPEPSEHASVPGESTGPDAQDATRPDIQAPGRPPADHGQGGSGGPPGAFRRGRARFRAWRRSRPFWGGLLLVLAGLELLLIPIGSLLVHTAIRIVIYIGIGGVFGVVFGCVIVACGLLAWFHPVQRVFYAVAGVVLALASFVATNLGGFFLGMLLGVIGASLVFGWTPVHPEERGRHRTRSAPAPSDGLDAVLGAPGAVHAPGGDTPPPAGPDRPAGPDPAAGGDPRPPPGGGTWHTGAGGAGLLALPIVPLLILAGAPGGGQAPAPASPAPGPAATATASPPVSPSPSASSSLSASPSPSATSPSPSVSGTGSPTPSPGRSVNPNAGKRASAASALVAASSPATLTAGSAVMVGAVYDGVATVPTASGSQQMLKFSMSSLTLSGGIVLTVGGNGHSMVTRNSSVHFSGSVVMYATKLSGDLLGVPVSFSPGSPPPLVLPVMQLSNVVTDQPLASADSMQADGLDITTS